MFVIFNFIISQIGMLEDKDNFIISVTNFTKHPQYNTLKFTLLQCFYLLIIAFTR